MSVMSYILSEFLHLLSSNSQDPDLGPEAVTLAQMRAPESENPPGRTQAPGGQTKWKYQVRVIDL